MSNTAMATITSSLASLGDAMNPLDQEIHDLSVHGQKQRMLESVMGPPDPVALQQVRAGYFAASATSLLADANIVAMVGQLQPFLGQQLMTAMSQKITTELMSERARLRGALDRHLDYLDLAGRVGRMQASVSDMQTAQTDTARQWDELQSGSTSGRVYLAKQRTDLTEGYKKRISELDGMFQTLKRLEGADVALQEQIAHNLAGITAGAAPFNMQDQAHQQQLINSSIRRVKQTIGLVDAGSKSKDERLVVPVDMQLLRGKELIANMDTWRSRVKHRLPIGDSVLDMIGHCMDPATATTWMPPSKKDGFDGVPESMVGQWAEEAKFVATEFKGQLSMQQFSMLQRPFKYGMYGNITHPGVDAEDGFSIYWALVAQFRPMTALYQADVKNWMNSSHNLFLKTDGDFTMVLKEIRSYLDEAKELGIRLEWYGTGLKYIEHLSKRANFAVDIRKFQEGGPDPQDCVYYLDEMLTEIEKTSAQEQSGDDVVAPFYGRKRGIAMAGEAMMAGYGDDGEWHCPDQLMDGYQQAAKHSIMNYVDMGAAFYSWQNDKGKGKGHKGKGKSQHFGSRFGQQSSVVPGRAMQQAYGRAGALPGRGTPTGGPRSMGGRGYGADGSSGVSSTSSVIDIEALANQADQMQRQSSLGGQQVPIRRSDNRVCFGRGCQAPRGSYDVCSTCHKNALQIKKLVAKDGREYSMGHNEQDKRKEEFTAVKSAARNWRSNHVAAFCTDAMLTRDEVHNHSALMDFVYGGAFNAELMNYTEPPLSWQPSVNEFQGNSDAFGVFGTDGIEYANMGSQLSSQQLKKTKFNDEDGEINYNTVEGQGAAYAMQALAQNMNNVKPRV